MHRLPLLFSLALPLLAHAEDPVVPSSEAALSLHSLTPPAPTSASGPWRAAWRRASNNAKRWRRNRQRRRTTARTKPVSPA